MTRTLICLIFFVSLSAVGKTQGIKPPQQEVGIIYKQETAFNLKITTNRGFAPGMEFGRLRTYYKTKFWHFNVGELKHAKEQRQSADPARRSFRPYVYGKQNTLLTLRGGWGVKRYYSEKAKQKGVAIGISYSFGPTLGLLKPYYLALAYPRTDGTPTEDLRQEKYSESNASTFLNNSAIRGASPFTKGLGEISVLPGGNASIAYHMDWGAFDEMVKAFEIGLMVDVFLKKAPILVTERNSQVFFNFFINLQLGKRR